LAGIISYFDRLSRKPDIEPRKSWGVFQKLHPEIFSRFLTKIAYSASVIAFGRSFSNSPLPSLILGHRKELSHYIGSAFAGTHRKSIHKYDLSFHLDGNYLVARVRIFADLGIPAYDVVLGDAALVSTTVVASYAARWIVNPLRTADPIAPIALR
jgi:hypothetical protein